VSRTNEPIELEELVAELIESEAFTGATLSKPRQQRPDRPARVTVDPVVLGGGLHYRWRYHERTRTSDENLGPEETVRRLTHLLGGEFRQGLLHSTGADHQVLSGDKRTTVLRRAATRPRARLMHDRPKRRVLEEGTPVPFLVALGVMGADGTVKARRYDKFKQVNRFLELVEDVLPALPDGRLRVVDFGSGKSYLTFAVHHLLTRVHGRDVDIVGLDLRADVVETCETLARKLELQGLRFEVGDIATYAPDGEVQLVVSLHACDTATDLALERAVRWQAQVILAVPCCQHEVSGQLRSDALAPLLARGLLRERFAADVTDAARAQLLEAVGYDTQVLELVSGEHTPKNVLIRAVSRPSRDRARAFREYVIFRDALGIAPTLERLLADQLPGRG
jgi:hypothetical protein